MFFKSSDSADRRGSVRDINFEKPPFGEAGHPRSTRDLLPEIERPRRTSWHRNESSSQKFNLPVLHGRNFTSDQDLRPLGSSSSTSKKKEFKGRFSYIGPSSCVTDFDLLPTDELNVATKREEQNIEESNALKRWEYWMKDKREMQEYLARRLGRSPCRLLIQESDKYRRWLEERWLSTCTQIPEADKWRGHPFRWKAEVRLPNRKIRWNQSKSGSPPDYCAVKTSMDKGEVPVMEFIGIPQIIEQEKGLICEGSTGNSRDLEFMGAEEAQYFLRRRKKLKPHEINMKELQVIGHKIPQPTEVFEVKKPSRLDYPAIKICIDGDASNPSCTEVQPTIFWLIIGEKQIKYEVKTDHCQASGKSYAWQINFGLNPVGSLVERVLRVENRGTIAVHYFWVSERTPMTVNLEKLQPKQYEPWFFFNKNSGFFLPGQIYNLKFYHKSTYSGVRKETWYLRTEPPLSVKGKTSTVTISAIATEDILQGKHPLEKYLDGRVKESIIKCMIEIILYRVFRPFGVGGIEYRSLFSKRILFEHNNPNLYYNSTLVWELNKIFREIEPSGADWDLSLDTLIRMVKNKKTGKERNSLLVKISEKAQKLQKRTYVFRSEDKKYRMVYDILCRMTNNMEDDYRFCRSSISDRIDDVFGNSTNDDGRKSLSGEHNSSHDTSQEEMGEYNVLDFWEIKPINFLFFKSVLYIRVYHRLCEAVEHITAIIETEKLFEPWKQVNYRPRKPNRKSRKN